MHRIGWFFQNNWSGEAALLAAKLLTRFRDMRPGTPERVEEFSRQVWSETARLSARAVLGASLGVAVDNNPLLEAVCAGQPTVGLAKISISPVVPIVAVGGPTRIYYGEVGARLECAVVFPQNCEVANAVGAAAGVVALSVNISVEGDGNGAFRVHGGHSTRLFASGGEALTFAIDAARGQALQKAIAMGADNPKVNVEVKKHHLPDAIDDNGLLSADIVAEAIGRPATL